MDEAVFVDADGQVEEVHSSVLDVKLGGELDVGVSSIQELDEGVQVFPCSFEEEEQVINKPPVELDIYLS